MKKGNESNVKECYTLVANKLESGSGKDFFAPSFL